MKRTRTNNISNLTLREVLDFVHTVVAENPGMHYDDFMIDKEYGYGDDCYPALEYETEETPKERAHREEVEKAQEKFEREQYEKLKDKFEGKSS